MMHKIDKRCVEPRELGGAGVHCGTVSERCVFITSASNLLSRFSRFHHVCIESSLTFSSRFHHVCITSASNLFSRLHHVCITSARLFSRFITSVSNLLFVTSASNLLFVTSASRFHHVILVFSHVFITSASRLLIFSRVLISFFSRFRVFSHVSTTFFSLRRR